MDKFSIGQAVRCKSGGRPMVFGGTLGDTGAAYLTWTDGNHAYAMVMEKDELEGLPKSSS